MVFARLARLAPALVLVSLCACSADTSGLSTGVADEGSGTAGDGESSSDAGQEGGSAGADQGADTDECPVGSEGCPCTPGGGCDPGLDCAGGVCEPASGTTSSTTAGDGDPDPTTTGDGDGDPDPTTTGGDGDLSCQLDDFCSQADPDACVCEGCNTNGFCGQEEDCVCPDCTNEPFCAGEACVTTGNCFPFFEGCSCPDCADHPLCG